MIKFFKTLSILLITTSAFSKDIKDTKKINSDICEDVVMNEKILGYSGSYNIRFIIEIMTNFTNTRLISILHNARILIKNIINSIFCIIKLK